MHKYRGSGTYTIYIYMYTYDCSSHLIPEDLTKAFIFS